MALEVPLAYLREVGAVDPATAPTTALDVLLGQYRDWLVVDRGLAPATVLRYAKTARRFLEQCSAARGGAVGSDRGRGERVPDRRVWPGVGGVGEGPGG